MAKVENILLQVLGYQSGSSYLTSATSGSYSSSTATPSFATVMSQLNKNLSSANTDNTLSSIASSSSTYSGLSQNTNPASAIVSLITQKVKDSKNSNVNIEQMVKDYLSDNYQGQADVISTLAGVTNLPNQVTQMQGSLYNQIVSKLTQQVRESVYNSGDKFDSLYSTDIETDKDSNSDTSVDLSDLNI